MTRQPGQQARLPLNVVIVGGGIGGIAAAVSLGRRGHHVVVLEAASKLAEIGAGIQISPNMARLLDRWQVPFHDKETVLQQIDVRRWQNGQLLSSTKCETVFGKPSIIHRADLHNALLETALSFENVTIRINSVVTGVDFDTPEVFLSDGSRIRGDVVLAADGIKSTIRPKLLQDKTLRVAPTGDAAYRFILSRKQMLASNLLKKLVDQPLATRWIGPGRHIVAYPLRNHELYNVVLVHPDRGTVDDQWTTKGSKQDMVGDFVGWEEHVRQLIASVDGDELMVWRLNLYPPLKTWVRGSVALLGDACHPMLPYVAQGAAQAVEDAGALGAILSSLSTRDEIPQALQVYERSRKQHAEQVQQSGGHNQTVLHLPDGPEQESRDELFRLAMQGGSTPDRWTDHNTRTSVWGHDAEEAALKAWDVHVKLGIEINR